MFLPPLRGDLILYSPTMMFGQNVSDNVKLTVSIVILMTKQANRPIYSKAYIISNLRIFLSFHLNFTSEVNNL